MEPDDSNQYYIKKEESKMDEVNDKKTANTTDPAELYEEEDMKQNKTIAGLAYILFFLPLIVCKDSRFGRFHANQGLLLLILSVAGYIVISVLTTILATITWRLFAFISLLYSLYSLFILALAIYGLVNGLNGKAKELPIIGKYRILQ